MKNDPINISFSFDHNYYRQAAVAIKSLSCPNAGQQAERARRVSSSLADVVGCSLIMII